MFKGKLKERTDSVWYVTYDKTTQQHLINHKYTLSNTMEQWPIEQNFRWVTFL